MFFTMYIPIFTQQHEMPTGSETKFNQINTHFHKILSGTCTTTRDRFTGTFQTGKMLKLL